MASEPKTSENCPVCGYDGLWSEHSASETARILVENDYSGVFVPALLRALIAHAGGVEVEVDRSGDGGFLRIASDLSDFPAGPALLLPMEGSE